MWIMKRILISFISFSIVTGLAVQLCPSRSHDSLEVHYELQPPEHEYLPPKKYDPQEPSTTYDFQEVFKKDDYQEVLTKDGYQEPLLASYQEPFKTYQEEPPKISYQAPSETYKEPPKTSYEDSSKEYNYQEPSKAFSYQEPSKKADYQDPVIVSYQEPPKTKDGYQGPVKTSSEESSKEYTYQGPLKTFDYQDPQKKDDYQEPATAYGYQEPHKKGDYQEPAKTYDGEEDHRDDHNEPSKAYSYQEPSKPFVHQKSTSEYQKSLDYKYQEPSYDSREHDAAYLASLFINVPGEGVPGKDYPILATVPYTGFSCDGLDYPGHYADYRARCQVYHVCQKDGRHSSFLCPNGTVFSQWYSVCDWWFNVDCDGAQTWFVYTRNGIILGKDADSSRPAGVSCRLPQKSRSGRVSKGLVVSKDYVPPVESSEVSYSAEEYKSLPTPEIYEVPSASHSSSSDYAVEYQQSTTTTKDPYGLKVIKQPSDSVASIKSAGKYGPPAQATGTHYGSETLKNHEHDTSEDSYETGTQGKPQGTSQESYTSKPHVNNFARRVVISVRNKADAKKPTSRYVTDVDSSEYDVSTTDVSHFRQGHVKPLFRDSVRRFETKRTTLVQGPRRPSPERSLITLYRDPQ